MEKFIENENITDPVQIFGELFGGYFKGTDSKNATKINGRIDYCNFNDFITFGDVRIGDKYMEYHQAIDSLNKAGFKTLKTLAEYDDLDKALQYETMFESTIPSYYDLKYFKNDDAKLENVCEGVVIKPNKYMCLHNGSRIIFKKKNASFEETKPKNTKAPKETIDNSIKKDIERYVTMQRMMSVTSKLSDKQKTDFGTLIKEMIADVMDDYKKDNIDNMANNNVANEKLLKNHITGLIRPLCKEYLSNAK